MKKLFINALPTLKIQWRTLDLRRWYYVWIHDVLCDWWACENELENLKKELGERIKFKKIPFWKTIIR